MKFALYCNILSHICILYNVIPMFYDVFGDFQNNPPSSGSNSVWQETPLFSVFEFPGATGLQNGQGQGPHHKNFYTNKMSSSGPPEDQGAGKEDRWHALPLWARHLVSFAPRLSD
jgi:hypothetical protein